MRLYERFVFIGFKNDIVRVHNFPTPFYLFNLANEYFHFISYTPSTGLEIILRIVFN